MAIDVAICSLALGYTGAESVTTPELITTRTGKVVSVFYSNALLKTLGDHNWNFAKKRVTLNSTGVVPAFEYGYTFTLPIDFLRLYKIFGTGSFNTKFKIEDGKLLGNTSTLQLQYISNSDDSSKFDPLFIDAFALRLAADICYQITQNVSLTTILEQKYEAALSKARRKNATDSSPEEIELSDFYQERF